MTRRVNTNPDFFGLRRTQLSDAERAELAEIREFLEQELAPLADEAWEKSEFPFEVFDKLAELDLAGRMYPEYSSGHERRSALFNGFLNLEMNRIDPSFAVAGGVHSGLAMGSIDQCGSGRSSRSAGCRGCGRMEKIGSFALSEPTAAPTSPAGCAPPRAAKATTGSSTARSAGSATPPSPTSSSSGRATDAADGPVKGFVVAKGTPGFTPTKMEGKLALRTVERRHRAEGCRVPERTGCRGPSRSRTPPGPAGDPRRCGMDAVGA